MAEANDTRTCIKCGTNFERPPKRGRPFTRCPSCRSAPKYKKVTTTCTTCGNGFEQLKVQGRPFQKCPDCRAKTAYQKKQYAPRQCQWCAEEFVPLRVHTRFCSNRCMYANRDSRRPKRVSNWRERTRPAECEVCGSEFGSYRSTGAPGGWTRCCSDRCGRISRRIRSGSILRSSRVTVTSHHGHCEGCSKHFRKPMRGVRYCSHECSPSAYVWVPEDKDCIGCGATFTQSRKRQRTCGEDCDLEIKRRHRRVAKSRRRARIRGREHEAIDPIRVFERDDWCCQLCHKRLRPEDRGTYKDEAPELDHVVPLAVGGSHTWGNVQLACRACNNAKGAEPAGQLGLAIPA